MICLGHLGYHFGLSGSGLIGKVFGQQPPPGVPLVAPHIRWRLAAVSGLRSTPSPCALRQYLFAKRDAATGVGVAVTLFVHDLLYEMYTAHGTSPGRRCLSRVSEIF